MGSSKARHRVMWVVLSEEKLSSTRGLGSMQRSHETITVLSQWMVGCLGEMMRPMISGMLMGWDGERRR